MKIYVSISSYFHFHFSKNPNHSKYFAGGRTKKVQRSSLSIASEVGPLPKQTSQQTVEKMPRVTQKGNQQFNWRSATWRKSWFASTKGGDIIQSQIRVMKLTGRKQEVRNQYNKCEVCLLLFYELLLQNCFHREAKVIPSSAGAKTCAWAQRISSTDDSFQWWWLVGRSVLCFWILMTKYFYPYFFDIKGILIQTTITA